VTVKPDEERAGHLRSVPGVSQRDKTVEAISLAACKAAHDLRAERCGDLFERHDWESCGAHRDLQQIEDLGVLAGCFWLPDQHVSGQEFDAVVDPGFVNYVLTCATFILRIPYVWAAVEHLAVYLIEVSADGEDGNGAIPAKEVSRILRTYKKRMTHTATST
jgi:hypothetical protein